ncbi:hypothetical protein YDYSY3_19530 [Paenibacillus chitinolyticus]|nr:hypothetical protein YDYSY3_19530 [Paenibacillus chitinolyticus]
MVSLSAGRKYFGKNSENGVLFFYFGQDDGKIENPPLSGEEHIHRVIHKSTVQNRRLCISFKFL